MANLSIIWDLEDDPEGNVQHIAEHGVSPEEVEEVLYKHYDTAVASRSSGEPTTFGWTRTGKYLAVVVEEVLEDPVTVRPVTAYEVPPPSTKKGKKRGH
jgi:hypothetical protein